MAADLDLPKNVVGILADCGYSSPREIIQKVIREMGLPVKVCYPFVKLGARLFGGFDLEETSAIEAIKKCKIPVLFIHGGADAYVPCEMTLACFESCPAPKKLHITPSAGHGLCFMVDKEGYLRAFKEFVDEYRVFDD